MEYFHGFSSHGPSFRMIEELKPFMEPGEKEMMEQMEAMMNMMEMMQGMQEMSEAASQNSDGSASQGFGAFNPMDLMKGMLSPDQQEMFNAYSSMFDEDMNQANSDNQKGCLLYTSVPVLSRRSVSTSPAASMARPLIASTFASFSLRIPAIPMADSNAPMVVGARQTRSAISEVMEVGFSIPA